MKLRLHEDSIRLRLTRPEVDELVLRGSLQVHTRIGPEFVQYGVRQNADALSLSASLAANSVIVEIPVSELRRWGLGEEIGLYGQQINPDGSTLAITVEKDFRCLDRNSPDSDDYYPHPQA